MIQPRILGPPHAGQLSVRDQFSIVVIWSQPIDFMPIIKSLRSSGGNRSFSRCTFGGLWVFQKNLIDPADRVRHRTMTEGQNRCEKEESEEETCFHKLRKRCVILKKNLPRIDEQASKLDERAKTAKDQCGKWPSSRVRYHLHAG